MGEKTENQVYVCLSFILKKKSLPYKLKNHRKKMEAIGTVPMCVIVSQISKLIQNVTNFVKAAITFQCTNYWIYYRPILVSLLIQFCAKTGKSVLTLLVDWKVTSWVKKKIRQVSFWWKPYYGSYWFLWSQLFLQFFTIICTPGGTQIWFGRGWSSSLETYTHF